VQVTVNIPDELAAQAREKGLSVEVYVEQVLAKQCGENGNTPGTIRSESDNAKIKDAIARMDELRKGVRLDGLKIKDLINEGRKY
jgi:hypothetical protein